MIAAPLETVRRHAERTDGQLLHAFAVHHDEAAFAQIVKRHGPVVLGVCRRVLGDSHDADDAYQAVFLVLARKAGSVRKGESLSSFLRGVSYRIAQRARRDAARRRRHEGLARIGPHAPAGADVAWREVQAILDEEVARLPDIYRAAFLLCCLQGHSHAEAARQLGVKEGTISSRLDNARRRLAEALGRRGISLSAALAAQTLAWQPASLLKRTLVAVVAAVAFLGATAAALLQKPGAAGETPTAKTAAAKDEAGSRVVAGRVLDPDGKPVRGAKVYVSTYQHDDQRDPPVRDTTDAGGRFRFTARKAEVERNEVVAAVAEGYGPDWLELGKLAPGATATLRLVKDEPIRGRILDLEGRPVAGATIRLSRVRKVPGEDLGGLVNALQARAPDRRAVHMPWEKYRRVESAVWGVLGVRKGVTTGKDGRFHMKGLGRERVVTLQVEGPTIAHASLDVLTRAGLKGLPPGTHGATFEHLAGPTKPICGVVKDRRTGKPVAGIRVNGQPALAERIGPAVSTTTDARGHFTLLGLPKAKAYHLNVGMAPYAPVSRQLADTPGLEVIRTTIEVERALALRVRVIDKTTGRPVRAMVQYMIRRDNPSLERYPTYPRNVVSWTLNDRDGWVSQTALPGPALVAVLAREGHFTQARLKDRHSDGRFIGNVFTNLWLPMFNAAVPIHPDEKDPKSLTVTVALDPGRSLQGRVVGPDGKPLAGAEVAGLHAVKDVHERETDRLTGSRFTATGLEPAHPRLLVFYHRAKKLAVAVQVRGDERGALTVRLGPLGALTGRLVDGNGKAVEGDVFVRASRRSAATLPGELTIGGLGNLHDTVAYHDAKTDAAGRFRLEGLVPGMKYDLWCKVKGGRFQEPAKDDLAVPSGKTQDVGDVRAGRAPRR